MRFHTYSILLVMLIGLHLTGHISMAWWPVAAVVFCSWDCMRDINTLIANKKNGIKPELSPPDFSSMLQILFIGLHFTKVIDWPWWQVYSVAIFGLVWFVGFLMYFVSKESRQ